ncbi:hypothetical protein VMCG_06615 [Cytospora schulzeri]|uniref:SecA Wing/Scaffold domain-containing protein n=1 Tax=Cytospora schulzeri TaxID=448051 RepID=A0A423W6U9_9PEZI|nr:hypothetical protein VMCG_06615 [Valsa malicola]
MVHMTPEKEAAFLASLTPQQHEAYVYAFKRELVDVNLRLLEELNQLMLTEDHLLLELDEWDWVRNVYRNHMPPLGFTQAPADALKDAEIVAKVEAGLVEVRKEIRKLVAQRPDWEGTLQSLATDESIGTIRRSVAVQILEAIYQPGILSDIVEEPHRGKPCPCGSRRKYKKCCGKYAK